MEEVATKQVLRGLQGVRAWQLALQFGHLWASAVRVLAWEKEGMLGEFPELPWGEAVKKIIDRDGFDLDEVEAVAVDMDKLSPVKGIHRPTFNEWGDIVHESGTGRLRWLIEPHGFVHIHVNRPGAPEMLTARIAVDGSWRVEVDAWHQPRIRARHVRALQEAVRAIVPEADVMRAVLDICPHVEMDPLGEIRQDVEEFIEEIEGRFPGNLDIVIQHRKGRSVVEVIPVEEDDEE